MEPAVRVVGLGGSLRKGSTSLAALQLTLEAAARAGASTRLFAVGELDLPMYRPGMDTPPAAQALLEATATAQGMVWSSPLYNGSVIGSARRDHGALTALPVAFNFPSTLAEVRVKRWYQQDFGAHRHGEGAMPWQTPRTSARRSGQSWTSTRSSTRPASG